MIRNLTMPPNDPSKIENASPFPELLLRDGDIMPKDSHHRLVNGKPHLHSCVNPDRQPNYPALHNSGNAFAAASASSVAFPQASFKPRIINPIRSYSDVSVLDSVANELPFVMDTQFGHDRFPVSIHRVGRDLQLLGSELII